MIYDLNNHFSSFKIKIYIFGYNKILFILAKGKLMQSVMQEIERLLNEKE